jgi:hypothetical protein
MSVNRPLRGWQAALEIRYEVASHESSEKELKEEEIGAERVATIVESERTSVLALDYTVVVVLAYPVQPGTHPAKCSQESKLAPWCWVPLARYLHWAEEASARMQVLLRHLSWCREVNIKMRAKGIIDWGEPRKAANCEWRCGELLDSCTW